MTTSTREQQQPSIAVRAWACVRRLHDLPNAGQLSPGRVRARTLEDQAIEVYHLLLGCPYCTGERNLYNTDIHWHCPNKRDQLPPWYQSWASRRSECPCGADCMETVLHHG